MIRNNFRITSAASAGTLAEAPFALTEGQDDFWVEFQSSRRLLVLKAGLPLFDGQSCELRTESTVRIRARLEDHLSIFDSFGNRWEVFPTFDSKSGNTFHGKADLLLILKPLMGSIAGHVAACLLAVLIVTQVPKIFRNAADRGGMVPLALGQNTLTAASSMAPFRGLGLRALEMMLKSEAQENASPASKLAQTTQALSGLFKGFKASALDLAGFAYRPNIDTLTLVAQAVKLDGLAEAEARLKLPTRSQSAGQVANGVYPQKELALRQRMDAIKPQLSRAYDRALRIDPSLSVTVAYEGVVNTTGHFSQIKLKSRGVSSFAALGSLEAGMRQELESFVIGKEFAGTALQGEHVFVK